MGSFFWSILTCCFFLLSGDGGLVEGSRGGSAGGGAPRRALLRDRRRPRLGGCEDVGRPWEMIAGSRRGPCGALLRRSPEPCGAQGDEALGRFPARRASRSVLAGRVGLDEHAPGGAAHQLWGGGRGDSARPATGRSGDIPREGPVDPSGKIGVGTNRRAGGSARRPGPVGATSPATRSAGGPGLLVGAVRWIDFRQRGMGRGSDASSLFAARPATGRSGGLQ